MKKFLIFTFMSLGIANIADVGHSVGSTPDTLHPPIIKPITAD